MRIDIECVKIRQIPTGMNFINSLIQSNCSDPTNAETTDNRKTVSILDS
jgi:hypothetical protein